MPCPAPLRGSCEGMKAEAKGAGLRPRRSGDAEARGRTNRAGKGQIEPSSPRETEHDTLPDAWQNANPMPCAIPQRGRSEGMKAEARGAGLQLRSRNNAEARQSSNHVANPTELQGSLGAEAN